MSFFVAPSFLLVAALAQAPTGTSTPPAAAPPVQEDPPAGSAAAQDEADPSSADADAGAPTAATAEERPEPSDPAASPSPTVEPSTTTPSSVEPSTTTPSSVEPSTTTPSSVGPEVSVMPPARTAASTDYPDDPGVSARPRRDIGGIVMTAVGFSVLGGSYLVSSLTGAIVADTRDDERLERFGRRMIIPVVGPWLALQYTDSATGAWFTGLAGVAQTAGLVVGTIGAVRLARNRADRQRLTFTSSPILGGGQVGLSGRF